MEEIIEFLGESAGWVVGVGAAIGVAALASSGGRPVLKKAIKGYLTVADRVKVATAEMTENLQDLYAEARMEYNTSGGPTSNGAASPIIVPSGGTV